MARKVIWSHEREIRDWKMDREIVGKVKTTILSVEPEAEIYLYGSRSRQDENKDSDWDFLVLVDGAVDSARTDRIRHLLYEVEWETGEVLSSIVRNREEWYSPKYRFIPLRVNIDREGVLI